MNEITITDIFWKYNAIGVAKRKITDENIIRVTHTDKDGNLSYPNDYYITKDMIKERGYLIEPNQAGTELVYIPTKDLPDLATNKKEEAVDNRTDEEKAIDKVFGTDPFDTEPDPRIKTTQGGYTKLQDGETAKMRVNTKSIWRYYTVTPVGAKYPMMNQELRELLEETTIDSLFDNEDFEIRERYAFVIYNWTTKQPEVWQVSRTVFNQLRMLNRDEDWTGGLEENDIKVTRTGAGTDTTYTINFVKDSQELTTELANQMLDLDVERMVASAVKL